MDLEKTLEILNTAYFSEHPDEAQVLSELPRLLRNVKFFVDVGASLGQFTKLASDCIDGRVLAVEADPFRFKHLQANCSAWSKPNVNIEVVHGAVGDRDGLTTFQVTNSQVSGAVTRHGLVHLNPALRAEVVWQETEVPACTLDSLCADSVPDFVKIDVEGAELRALMGATRILATGRTTWLIELHEFGPDEELPTASVPRYMRNFGYTEVSCYGKSLFVRDGWRTVPGLMLRTLWHRTFANAKRFSRSVVASTRYLPTKRT
jgi:FkbM family methyltransferase